MRSNVIFNFMLECLRWGPTSLQTVKMSECEFYTVCTQLGGRKHKIKTYFAPTKANYELQTLHHIIWI